ncbi:MAG: DinB family protein [Candidatus Aminicenantes bacterium]|nr:DinB family protein [Candidatus Aminicenantes bacterium]
MDWHDLMADGFNRVPEFLENVLRGLTQAELNWMPRKDSNSIGWLVWHLTRQQDAQITSLIGDEEVWIKDKWYARFNRDANLKDIGFGHTPEQVAAFQSPDIPTLLGYLRATVERTTQFLRTLTENDLDRELDEPQYHPLPTVGVRLISILDDSVLHAGQAAYIRGMIQGKGWQKY